MNLPHLFLAVLLASAPSPNSTTSPAAEPQVAAPPSLREAPQPNVTRSTTQNVELLEQQARMLELFHDSILDTVYWALGGVFTMAFLLAGFSWLNNNKLYSIEKARTKEELEARLLEVTSDLQLSEQQHRNNHMTATDGKLDSLINRLNGDISEIRRTVEDLRTRIEEDSGSRQDLEKRFDRVLSGISKKLERGTAVSREIEEHVWDLKKVPTNILITQGQGLAASMAADNESTTQRILARMKRTIESEFVAKDEKIPSHVFGLISDRLESAQKIFPVEASEVLQLLQENLAVS